MYIGLYLANRESIIRAKPALASFTRAHIRAIYAARINMQATCTAGTYLVLDSWWREAEAEAEVPVVCFREAACISDVGVSKPRTNTNNPNNTLRVRTLA